MKTPQPMIGRAVFGSARLAPGFATGIRPRLVVVAAMLAVWLPHVEAAIRFTAFNSALFKQGYLDVTTYGVIPNDASKAAANTSLINEALKDAYNLNNDTPIWGTGGQTLNGSLALYFPPGTYYVNNTLTAHTATGRAIEDVDQNGNGKLDPFDGINHATPRNHLAIVGDDSTGVRPVIRLANNSPGFNNASAPKVLLEFRNVGAIYRTATGRLEFGTFIKNADGTYSNVEQSVDVEDPSRGYHQMLRGIDLHCGTAGNAGTIALHFNQAQESSVENVKITAGAALTGIRGLPGRGWGAVNVEVDGGKVGIDLMAYPNTGTGPGLPSTGNVGSVIVGAKLTNQSDSAVKSDGFVPLTLVGFEIDHPNSGTGVTNSAIQIQAGTNVHNSLINLIDGTITLHNTNHSAIDNNTAAAGKSLYVRNVYVTGSNKLVVSPSGTYTASGTATWKQILEYSYRDSRSSAITGGTQIAQKFINHALNTAAVTASKDDTPTPVNPPANLRTQHIWGSLPSVDSANVIDVTIEDPTIVPAVDDLDTRVVNHTKLQAIIDAYSAPNPKKRIFLPKGIYRLTGPITLRSNTALFGAARHLTRIEVAPSWTAQLVSTPALRVETPMITTTSSATATTYLGDLSIGVDTSDNNIFGDWFTALDWKAGRNSMVHIGQVYRSPALDSDGPTNDHSLLKVTGNGGGRWYFAGARKTGHGENANFRILEVAPNSAKEPLWFYGLNLEHPGGPTEYALFSNAGNIRCYGEKSEYHDDDAQAVLSGVLKFNNTTNAAIFGMGAIRNGLNGGKGAVDFIACGNVLATLIAPQTATPVVSGARTLREDPASFPIAGINYPNLVSLYKDGSLDDTLMTHTDNISY